MDSSVDVCDLMINLICAPCSNRECADNQSDDQGEPIWSHSKLMDCIRKREHEAKPPELYLITINDYEFVYLDHLEIHADAYHVSPSTVADMLAQALKVKKIVIDGQPLADDLVDYAYVELCDKLINRHLEFGE